MDRCLIGTVTRLGEKVTLRVDAQLEGPEVDPIGSEIKLDYDLFNKCFIGIPFRVDVSLDESFKLTFEDDKWSVNKLEILKGTEDE